MVEQKTKAPGGLMEKGRRGLQRARALAVRGHMLTADPAGELAAMPARTRNLTATTLTLVLGLLVAALLSGALPEAAWAQSNTQSCAGGGAGAEIIGFFDDARIWLVAAAIPIAALIFLVGLAIRAFAFGNQGSISMGNMTMGGAVILVIGCGLVLVVVNLFSSWAGGAQC